MAKLKTIKLQGKDYVQVKTRIIEFHNIYKKGKIITEPTFNAEAKTVIFKATVTPNIEQCERLFTGHSFGVLGTVKALEKLETIAVGRAMAFLGIGLDDGAEIASEDEMGVFKKKTEKVDETLEKMGVCSLCGKTAQKAKTSKGIIYPICPDYEIHKEKGEKYKIVQPPNATKEQAEFQKELDNL